MKNLHRGGDFSYRLEIAGAFAERKTDEACICFEQHIPNLRCNLIQPDEQEGFANYNNCDCKQDKEDGIQYRFYHEYYYISDDEGEPRNWSEMD